MQMMAPRLPDEVLFTVQCALMVVGFWLAAKIARRRGRAPSINSAEFRGWRLLPVLAFIGAIAAMNLWLMAHDMELRF